MLKLIYSDLLLVPHLVLLFLICEQLPLQLILSGSARPEMAGSKCKVPP